MNYSRLLDAISNKKSFITWLVPPKHWGVSRSRRNGVKTIFGSDIHITISNNARNMFKDLVENCPELQARLSEVIMNQQIKYICSGVFVTAVSFGHWVENKKMLSIHSSDRTMSMLWRIILLSSRKCRLNSAFIKIFRVPLFERLALLGRVSGFESFIE